MVLYEICLIKQSQVFLKLCTDTQTIHRNFHGLAQFSLKDIRNRKLLLCIQSPEI